MNNYKYKTQYAFTLYEVARLCEDREESFLGFPFPTFKNFINYYGLQLPQSDVEYWSPQGIGGQLWKALYLRFRDHVIIIQDEDIISQGMKSPVYWIEDFYSDWNLTKDKYNNLLTIYKDKLSHLMDKIKSEGKSVARYNDTPQESGLYEDDAHSTNITQGNTMSESDGASVMGRIAEIQDQIRNTLKEWTNEFSGLFIEEGNI